MIFSTKNKSSKRRFLKKMVFFVLVIALCLNEYNYVKAELGEESKETITIENFDRNIGIISSADIYDKSVSANDYVVIPVVGGESISLQAGDRETYFAVLTEWNNPEHGTVPIYSKSEEWSSRKVLKGIYKGTIPLDAKFLYVQTSMQGNNTVPQMIKIDGKSMIKEKTITIENEKQSSLFSKAKNKLILCIVDDDTVSVQAVSLLEKACEEKGIKCTFATLTNKWENNKGLRDKLLSLEQSGYNIILHAYSQEIDDCWTRVASTDTKVAEKALEECRINLMRGMRDMSNAGFVNWHYWATPNNTNNEMLRSLARQLGFDCKLIGNNQYNIYDGSHSRYEIMRVALNQDDTGSTTFEQVKSITAECAEERGWLVVMTHFGTWKDNNYTRLTEYVDYAKSLGYEFMTLAEAWSYKKAIYDYYDQH